MDRERDCPHDLGRRGTGRDGRGRGLADGSDRGRDHDGGGKWQRQSTDGSRDHDRDHDRDRNHQGWRGSFRSPQGPPTSDSARVDSADRAVNVALRDAVQRAKRDQIQMAGAVRSAEELMASKLLGNVCDQCLQDERELGRLSACAVVFRSSRNHGDSISLQPSDCCHGKVQGLAKGD